MFGKCEKHGCFFDYRETDGGKTIYYCPQCESERRNTFLKIANAFTTRGESIEQAADELAQLRARNAELERQLAEENEHKKVWENLASDYADKNLELAQRAEQAEQRLAEAVKAVLDEAKSRILNMTFIDNPHVQATVTTCIGVLDTIRARSTK